MQKDNVKAAINECGIKFIEDKLMPLFETAIEDSRDKEKITFRNQDRYVDYFENKTLEIIKYTPFSFVPFHLNTEDFCQRKLVASELVAYGHHQQNMKQPVLYEQGNIKVFDIKHKTMDIWIQIEYLFNYEVSDWHKKIHERYVTLHMEAFDRKFFPRIYFYRTEMNGLLYLLKILVQFDYSPLEEDILHVRTEQEVRQKLVQINRTALSQFMKKFCTENNISYAIHDSDGDYCFLEIKFPKNLELSFKVDYANFTSKREELKKLMTDTKSYVISTSFVPYICEPSVQNIDC